MLWKLVCRDYIQQGNALPDGGLAVVYWSNDGRYAYFNSFVSGSGGECFVNGNALNYGKGLFRLDLATGYSTTILPLKENFTGYDFSFSSTGRRLVYETYLSGVKVLDLKTGEVITVSSMNEFNGAGGFLWSPDGLQFVYSTVMYTNYGGNNKYSLRFVDAQLGIEQIMFESQENCFFTKLWSADNILTIENYDKNYNRTLVDFDLNTNTVISETNSP